MAIPPGTTARTDFHRTTDIEEAAALQIAHYPAWAQAAHRRQLVHLTDGIRPFPDPANFIRNLRPGKGGTPYHEFRFHQSAEQRFISGAFRARADFIRKNPAHPLAFVIQCFETRRELHRALTPRCPTADPAFAGYITNSLKLAATILATEAGRPQPDERSFIRRTAQHFVFQFDHTPAVHEIHEAFAKPEPFYAAHRDHWLAQVIAAFFIRELFAARLHDVPLQRIERTVGKKTTTIKVIPEKSHV